MDEDFGAPNAHFHPVTRRFGGASETFMLRKPHFRAAREASPLARLPFRARSWTYSGASRRFAAARCDLRSLKCDYSMLRRHLRTARSASQGDAIPFPGSETAFPFGENGLIVRMDRIYERGHRVSERRASV
jgi:hypothetical protein